MLSETIIKLLEAQASLTREIGVIEAGQLTSDVILRLDNFKTKFSLCVLVKMWSGRSCLFQ